MFFSLNSFQIWKGRANLNYVLECTMVHRLAYSCVQKFRCTDCKMHFLFELPKSSWFPRDYFNLGLFFKFAAITFMLNGYGDIVPHSQCGRTIAITVGVVVSFFFFLIPLFISKSTLLKKMYITWSNLHVSSGVSILRLSLPLILLVISLVVTCSRVVPVVPLKKWPFGRPSCW